MLIKNGFKVLFQGDSITDCHRTEKYTNFNEFYRGEDLGFGHPKMIASSISAAYPELDITYYNRAISGNRTCDLVARWENDCLAIYPDVMILMIGLNDVWRKFDSNDPTSNEQFIKNYEYLLSSALKSNPNMKIVIIEPTYQNINNAHTALFRAELLEKIEAIRILAKKYKTHYLALDGIFSSLIMKTNFKKWFYDDGVHLTIHGYGILSKELLKIIETSR